MFPMASFALSDKLKKLLGWTAIIVVCLLLVWANFAINQAKEAKIEGLNDRVTVLKGDKVVLEDKNKALKIDIKNKASSDNTTELVKVDVKAVEVKQEKVKTQAAKQVEKKLEEINQKYEKLEQSQINHERKAVEISLERAKGLWVTYCNQAPTEEACK